MKIYQYLYRLPIEETRTGLYMVNMRNFMLEESHDETMMERNQYVAFQDRDILLTLHPKTAPRTSARDLLTPSDYAVGRYRQWLAGWEARGWRIDTEKVRKAGRAYRIRHPQPGTADEKRLGDRPDSTASRDS